MDELKSIPLVSIGFLTYNHFTHLDPSIFINAIESLINQNYSNKEILIFDDCSTDGTYEMCQQYANKYSFIKLHRNPSNLGAISNLEQLLSYIKGDFFFWACPDDSYDSNYITTCIEQFHKNNNATVVLTGVKVTYDNGDIRHFKYIDFSIHFPLLKHVRNVLQDRDHLGNHVLYPPAIHSAMIKTKYIYKLYCRDQFFGLEETWFLNGLIWGDVDYVDQYLYFRKSISVPYSDKNPEIHDKFSKRNIYLVSNYKYLKYFIIDSQIDYLSKLKYFYMALLFLWYRSIPYLIANFKADLFCCLNKIGMLKYQKKSN